VLQGRCRNVRKISPPPGFDPRTVQPLASRYTVFATWSTIREKAYDIRFFDGETPLKDSSLKDTEIDDR